MISLPIPLQLLAAAALCLALWAACAGVGMALLPQRDAATHGPGAPTTWRQPGIAACVGLCVLLALGGFATALSLPFWITVVGFGIAGLTLAARELLKIPWRRLTGPVVVTTAVAGVALVAVAIVEATLGFRQVIQPCDDLRAYIPLANKLVDTGGLDEAWSFRRLQNLGGITFLQAVPVGLLGERAISVAETCIASVFLGGLFVSTGLRTTWTRVLGVVFVVAIPILFVPRLNSAVVLLAVPLLIACFAGIVEVRAALKGGDFAAAWRWGVAIGLASAAVASLRITLAPIGAVAVVAGLASVGGVARSQRVRVLAVSVGTGVLAIAPWCFAMWQSSGTALYPVLQGNANPSGPPNSAPYLNTLSEQLDHVYHLLISNPYFWVALVVLVLAVLGRRYLPDAGAVLIAAAVVVGWIPIFAITGSLVTTWDFSRYIAPMAQSLVLFFAFETFRAVDVADLDRPRGRRVLAGVGLAVALVAISFIPVGGPLLAGGAESLRLAFGSQGEDQQRITAVAPPRTRAMYRRALRGLDLGQTIVAVDHPDLIDSRGHDVPNMDFPGWAVPGGRFPFFSGPGPKIAALRDHGYETLVLTEPNLDVCYPPSYVQLEIDRHIPSRESSIFARYFLDWDNDIAEITVDAPRAVRRVGSVLVIDLARAQSALAQGTSGASGA